MRLISKEGSARILVVVAVGVIGAVAVTFWLAGREKSDEYTLVPRERERTAPPGSQEGTEVGTGWSCTKDSEDAMREAIGMALRGAGSRKPDFATVFATSGSDLKTMLLEARRLFGGKTKIYGGTSDSRAVMTDKGFIRAGSRGYGKGGDGEKRNAVAILTVTSKDIVFGVGAADFTKTPSVQEGTRAALLDAIRNAGRTPQDHPRAILLTPTLGVEEEVVEGVEQVVRKDVAIVGGTTGGPVLGVLGENEVYQKGVSLAVIYTDLPMGWTFEGGFDVAGQNSGIVTATDGQAIVEIEGRPALDVYNEWLNGKILRLHEEGAKPDVVRDLLILHPLYRKYTSSSGRYYFLFSHPWPRDDKLEDKAVMTSTKIKEGERVFLSRGTWETFVNRIGNLPQKAKVRGAIPIEQRPILGLGSVCAGVMGVIPESEREKLPLLINYANKNAPFIVNFTWGEQGHFPEVGNKHGNLLTAFLVIGPRE